MDSGLRKLLSIRTSIVSAGEYFPYSEDEILNLYSNHKETLKTMYKRAKSARYSSDKYALWISLNLTYSIHFEYSAKCYYCDLPFRIENKDDLKNIHVEHFFPISNSGDHSPPNVIPSCAGCNMLKKDFIEDDFMEILNTPEEFFANHRGYKTMQRRKKLILFSEIILPRYNQKLFIDRYCDGNFRKFQEVWRRKKAEYRKT